MCMSMESNTTKNRGVANRVLLATAVIFISSILLLVAGHFLEWKVSGGSFRLFIAFVGFSAVVTDQIYIRFFAGSRN